MPRPIQIKIPKPCHENWDEMLPAAKGRHCLSCQKTVVDFTNMTDGDILLHLKKAATHRAGAELCGRFMPDQLNRQLVPPPPLRAGFHWRGWQWIIAGMLLTSDVTTPSRRPPMQEQRMPTAKTNTTEDLILGGMSFTARTCFETPVVSDTVEMGTPSVLMGDVAVLPPDSLMRPSCIHRPDSTDDKLDKVYTGGIEVIDADSTKISPDPTVTSSDSTIETAHATELPVPTTPIVSPLRIYPNPIPRGSTYHIQFPAEGEYQLALFNISGALVQQQTLSVINHTNEFQLPTGLTPGIYILRATRNAHPQPYTAKLLIQ